MKKFFYRVQLEDSLLSISAKFCIPAGKIIKENNLDCEISAGDLLYLESNDNVKTYKVMPFDTLESLAKRFNITEERLLEINCVPYIFFSQTIMVE